MSKMKDLILWKQEIDSLADPDMLEPDGADLPGEPNPTVAQNSTADTSAGGHVKSESE